MRAAVSLEDGLGLDSDRCIHVIPRQKFHTNEDANVNIDAQCKRALNT